MIDVEGREGGGVRGRRRGEIFVFKVIFLFEGFLVSLNLNKVLVSKCVFFWWKFI